MTASASPVVLSRPGTLLHVGCGYEPLPPTIAHYGLTETRLDIDARCEPDIVGSMTDLGEIGPFDVVYSSHCLEHLAPHDVPVALGEFIRVLSPGGMAVTMVPDLQGVEPTDEVLFVSPAGPISGLDLIYGFRPALKAQPHMAHRTGFTAETLRSALTEVGFSSVTVERLPNHNLLALAHR